MALFHLTITSIESANSRVRILFFDSNPFKRDYNLSNKVPRQISVQDNR